MLKFQKLRDEYATLHGEATAIIDAAGNSEEPRELTADEKTANEKRFTRMKQIKDVLDEDAKFAALAIENDDPNADPEADPEAAPSATDPKKGKFERPRDPKGRREYERKDQPVDDDDPFVLDDKQKRQYAREVKDFTKSGEFGPIAKKFATITTTTGSGILLPRSILPPLTPNSSNVFRELHDIYGVKPIETSGTADLTLPVLDATAGGVVAENASSETENAPSTSESIKLTPKTYQSGSVWFSNQQLAANDFDVLANVVPQLTYSKELGFESAMVAALIADAGITQTVVTATTTGFTYANLVDLNHAIPKRYSRQMGIVLGKDAFSAAEKLVGSDGHPVLIMDPQNEGLAKFNGNPVLRSDYFEAFGTTKVIGAVVSLLGFKIRDVTVQNLARYVNIPSRPNQTGLDLFGYHAYGWAPSAVAKLVTPAS